MIYLMKMKRGETQLTGIHQSQYEENSQRFHVESWRKTQSRNGKMLTSRRVFRVHKTTRPHEHQQKSDKNWRFAVARLSGLVSKDGEPAQAEQREVRPECPI